MLIHNGQQQTSTDYKLIKSGDLKNKVRNSTAQNIKIQCYKTFMAQT